MVSPQESGSGERVVHRRDIDRRALFRTLAAAGLIGPALAACRGEDKSSGTAI
jgi:hypothetical protein